MPFNALMDPSQIGMSIQNAFTQGMENRRRMEAQRAMGEYAKNQNAENAQNVTIHDPMLGMRMIDREEKRAAQERQMVQQRLSQVARLFNGVTPENYVNRLGIAQQMGIDVSSVPQQFDPNWVAQQGQIYSFLAEKPEALSTAGKQAIDLGYQPGTPQFNAVVQQIIEAGLAQPYMGSGGETRLYTPRLGAQPAPMPQQGPQPGTVEDGYRFRGGNPADPNAWEAVGGPTPQASAGFPAAGY